MNLNKKATALSLAVLVVFGASACSAGESSGSPSPSQSQVITEQSPKESVRGEAISTMNKAHELKKSREFMDFHNKVSKLQYGEDGLPGAQELFEDNSKLVNDYESLVAYSDANKDAVINIRKAYGGTETLKDEDLLRKALDVSAFTEESSHTEDVNGEISYNIIPETIQEKDGKFFVTGDNVYTQDENNAVINFPFSEKTKLYLENGGKKIILDTDSDKPASKPAGWYTLQADVKNAAVSIEYWIVDQKGKTSEIAVENDSIVSGFIGENSDQYKFDLDEGTSIKVEGDSNAYIITGTYEGLEEEVIYDSAEGGLQPSKVKPTEKAEPKPEPGVDYTLWSAYAEKVYSTKSGGLVSTDNSIEEAVGMLNKDIAEGESYEVTEKNGKKYIQVTSLKSKIGSNGSLLWVYDRTAE